MRHSGDCLPRRFGPALVTPGQTGFLVDDEEQMADACSMTSELDPGRCRQVIVERCDVRAVAAAYEEVYRRVAAPARITVGRALAPPTERPRLALSLVAA